MRIVAWNCARALHRKIDALMALRPDVAVISEAAKPKLLVARAPELADASLVWVGKYPNQGLLLAGFGTTVLEFGRHLYDDRLHWIAPVSVSGLPDLDKPIHLLGVRAQNASGGNRRKDNPGPLRQALRRYDGLLMSESNQTPRLYPPTYREFAVNSENNSHSQWRRRQAKLLIPRPAPASASR